MRNRSHTMKHQSTKAEQALVCFVLFAALTSGVGEYFRAHHVREPVWWQVITAVLGGVILFAWYYSDSESRGYPRSRWLNVGIVAFWPVAVPYYVIRSRPKGQKGKALLDCLGFFIWVLAASLIGRAVSSIWLALPR